MSTREYEVRISFFFGLRCNALYGLPIVKWNILYLLWIGYNVLLDKECVSRDFIPTRFKTDAILSKRILDMEDPIVREFLGFESAADVHRLFVALKWPPTITIGCCSDDSKNYETSSEFAFLLLLLRYHTGAKWTVIEIFSGKPYNTCSAIVSAAERWIVSNHAWRLQHIDFFVPYFPQYCAAIKRKIESMGDMVPPEAEFCMEFLDRTSIQIARPDGVWLFQQLFWSFKSRMHCLAFQALVGPDELIMHLWGPLAGSHSDLLLLSRSCLNDLLERIQQDENGNLLAIFYWAYTDRGYDSHSCIRAAHRLPAVTVFLELCNLIMSSYRIIVEWGFGYMKNLWPIITDKKTMKLNETCVSSRVEICALLTNARIMISGSASSA